MGEAAIIMTGIDAVARETSLFAAIWFLVGGIDDLMVDLIYGWRRARIWWAGEPDDEPPATLVPGRIAIFVAAWDESAVIGDMLRTALARFDYPDYRIYVGAYPNDRPTIDAVHEVAKFDGRVRLVIGPGPGPTTKADCLNAVWRALVRDEAASGVTTLAVALHDAEDVVHPLELRAYAHELARHDAVQLPVLPVAFPGSRWISGHYIEEFVEAHAKQLLVRQTLGAGMPLAGVGCAIRRDMIQRIAEVRGGAPFDATSLTEDYELGLTIAAMGGSTVLSRTLERPGVPIAVRAYFPSTLSAAVRQKGRWMTGIALAGWDRTGWAPLRDVGDHWMRMRDRRATLAIPVLATAYLALLAWGVSAGGHALAGSSMPLPDSAMLALLITNGVLLAWRLVLRALLVGQAYGVAEAMLSIPRVFTGNLVALLAARRAAFAYARLLAGAVPQWDKTAHHFPENPEAATT